MPVVEAVSTCPTPAVPVIDGAPVAGVFARVLNAVAPMTHSLDPLALVTLTRTSYAVFACRPPMAARVTGVSPAYQLLHSVVPCSR